jgi:SAM-dependent methyltransferase
MITDRKLPPYFLDSLKELERSYLLHSDPILQSGFAGGEERWREEREPILRAVDSDGDFLDVGCANGFLLECLMKWALKRGIHLTPFGVDASARLIELAEKRFPDLKSNFHVANAWDWQPPRRFRYVYTLHDCVPVEFLEEYVQRLSARYVDDGGRLIIGAYGSRSKNVPPFDIEGFLQSSGITIRGKTSGGKHLISSFVWIDK